MVIIYDPKADRFRDTDTGQFALRPFTDEEETIEFTIEERYGRNVFRTEVVLRPTFIEWTAEVYHRLADRTKAGIAYDIILITITTEEGDIPSEEDFLVLAQAEIAENRLAYGIKSFQRME